MTASAGARGAADHQRLAARAVELAREPTSEDGGGTTDMLLLRTCGQQVAVPLRDVREIRPPGPLTQVPGADGVLAGIVGGYGEALPVASLAGLLGLTATVPADAQWVAVLDDPTAPLGLLVDSAIDIVAVATRAIDDASERAGLVATVLADGSMVLRTDVVLRDPRLTLTSAESTKELSWHDA